MRVIAFFFAVVVLLALWEGIWWLGFGVSPHSPWTLAKEIRHTTPPVIIDVRTSAEFDWFHIPGAINVAYPATFADLAQVSPDPTVPVVVVCMTGHRSPFVVRQLSQGGYTDVSNLTGGMVGWKLFGGESVSGH